MDTSRHDDEFEHVWHQAVSRRSLLHAAGLTAGGLAVGSVLSACTSEQGPGGAQSTSLTVSMGGNFGTGMDPATASDLWSLNLISLVFEKLYRISPIPPRKVQADLATDLPRQVSPTVYRIRLREGVTFHDGSPLTADDVVFTLRRVQDPKTKSLYARFLSIIETARAVDPAEVELTLSTPTTLLAERLALIGIMSRSAVGSTSAADLKIKPVGTGPYRVANAVSNQKVKLARFGDYSGPRRLKYKKLTMNVVSEGNARVSALRSGQAQVIEVVPPTSFAGLKRSRNIETGSVAPGDTQTVMLLHCGKRPFDDKRVRQALLYAIDREAITRTSFLGEARPAWDGIIPSEDADFAKPETTYRFDPDRAKKLLAEAGYSGKKLPITFLYGNDNDSVVSQAPVIERNLRDVGFEPDMVPGATESLYSRVTAGRYNVLLQLAGPAGISPDAEFVLRWLYYGSVPSDFLYWKNDAAKQVGKWLDQAQAAADPAERKALLAKVQDLVQEESPIGVLHFVNGLTAWSDRLRSYEPTPSGLAHLDGVRG